jgi:hypothetical protein
MAAGAELRGCQGRAPWPYKIGLEPQSNSSILIPQTKRRQNGFQDIFVLQPIQGLRVISEIP